jgi:flagellar hook-basal body complex protein FliE
MALTNAEKTLKLKVELEVAQTNANAKKLQQALSDLDGRTKEYKATLARLNLEVKKNIDAKERLNQMMFKVKRTQESLDVSTNQLINGKDGKGGLSGVSAASGSASAATLELGRVISDAPYGIRGMANNASQLASNLLYASTAIDAATGKAIGFSGAMKAMWASIKGPLGVLLAIQVVISALDYFFGATKKAEDGTKDLNKELKNQIDIFRLYDEQLKNNNLSLEERLETLNAISKLDKDLAKSLKAAGDDVEKQKNVLEDFLKQKEVELKLKEQELILLDAIEKSKAASAEADKERASDRADVTPMATGGFGGGGGVSPEGVTQQFAGTKSQTIKDEEAAQEELNKQLQIYTDLLNQINEEESKGGGRAKRIKEFKAGLLDLSSELKAYRQKEIQNADISDEERLKREYEASKKSIENKKLEFEEKERLRLKDKIKEINESKATEDEKAILIADANAKYNASIAQANEDLRSVMLQADIAYYSELAALRRQDTEEAKKQAEDLASSLRDGTLEYLDFVYAQDIQRQTNELDRIEAERAANIALTDLKVQNLEKEAQKKGLTAAQIQDINNQIAKVENDRTLYQEQLDIKAGQTKLAIANQVANAIIAIAGEGSGLAKGVAVAQTIWNTKQGVMAALGSAPYGPWNIAQAAAVAAMGVKNVANIIATKAPNEKSSGVSASAAGGGTTFMPDFNIVGASGTNQLASTVAGQLGEPTRAYVVYDDLRTAGEIEANAVTAAGI